MKTLSIISNDINELFTDLQRQLGGQLEVKSNEFQLQIDNEIAKGRISGIPVENAILYMEYDLVFHEDLSILYKIDQSNSVYFGYCSQGTIKQSTGTGEDTKEIEAFQTIIFSNTDQNKNALRFSANEHIKFSIVIVDALSVSDHELRSQLKNTFLDSTNSQAFSYVGSLNLRIFDKIQSLKAISEDALVRNLLTNSTIYLILALEIEQHRLDTMTNDTAAFQLNQYEMKMVKELSDSIIKHPAMPYSIKYLSKRSGLSPLKLQEGFKILHNRTVTDFVRNARVEIAENLIRTSELNISEIVYTIGLTSRSYFSKIFKEKYNCCPKYYQNRSALSL
ncbi:hypothetical protein FFWV33_08735 [Flavobacterium faecale]|uniref:HTH araC/xylS-type domain-containing protein n=1 Tax=Flavobacterium faecale TaxID=1355330 RepID=A0A2S1LCY1_9FLAO|nr:AraC family transcriptional regulator [Flavobacterium faecale]AWG21613.1 hypothetical protein FFWV33_08735 [Flavobacterium faecale]